MKNSIRKIAAAVVTLATAIMPFASATPAFAAAPNWNTTGNYVIAFDLGGTPYSHDLSLTQTGAALTGNGGNPTGGTHVYTWVLTSGTVDGDSINFTADYTATADAVSPQTTMIVSGTIAGDGSMSGTWSDNYQNGARNGTWISTSGNAAPIAQTVCSTLTLVSGPNDTLYKGQTTTDPAGSSNDILFAGGTAPAVVAGPDGYAGAWDTTGNNPILSGASWVNNTATAPSTPPGAGGDGNVNTWRLFGQSFTLPAGAIVSSASVNFSADNSATAFYDNASVGTVTDFNTITNAIFGATAGTHELEFVTKNDAANLATNPTAVIYKATIEYCVPVQPPAPQLVTVIIDKFIDGSMATAGSANSSAFPMTATWSATNIGAGTGTYDLDADGFNGDPTPYQAITSPMSSGADYTTSEITGGSVVGASCADGKPFALVGYSSGNTLAEAQGATVGPTAPIFTGLTSSKYVIVWNTACPTTGTISGAKFWDVNGNSVWNAGEPGLSGWTFNLAGGPTTGSQVTGTNGVYTFANVLPGTYSVTEVLQSGWTQTVASSSFALAAGENKTGINIGNACFVSTGGKGKGYWTNKNGEATLNDNSGSATEMAMLSNNYNLRNANGTDFDPTSYSSYKTWNTNANAVNMSYMLSAQLSALVLSVEAGFIDGTKQIVITDPALASITSSLGLITINDLITAANAALGDDVYTPAGDINRAYQEALKNAVEKAIDSKIQLCSPYTTTMTFTATDSAYYNGMNVGDGLYATGPFSFTWDSGTGNVTGGLWEEIVPAVSGTHYFNEVVSGTVIGGVVNLTLNRTVPNAYGPFNLSGTLVGNVLTGTAAGPYLLTATGVVTP